MLTNSNATLNIAATIHLTETLNVLIFSDFSSQLFVSFGCIALNVEKAWMAFFLLTKNLFGLLCWILIHIYYGHC